MKINEIKKLSNERLLKVRIKDLELEIKGSLIERRITQLYNELDTRGIKYKPHIWISDEWFTPDDIPGFAVPFYLIHPRLKKLEKDQMFEAEGADKKECMQIMRHETGHAISHAYQLYHRKKWKKYFGNFLNPYPLSYVPQIESKNFVTHINAWYAQAHPLEDFAETFAVWLDPKSNWQRKYRNWPVLEKLHYLDGLMQKIKGLYPLLVVYNEYLHISKLDYILNEHYTRKKNFYSVSRAESFDNELMKVFTLRHTPDYEPSSGYLKKIRRTIRKNIPVVLDVPQYTVDQLMLELIKRCDQLNLFHRKNNTDAEKKLLVILTSQITNLIYKGFHKIPL
jgi:hypothetical protein